MISAICKLNQGNKGRTAANCMIFFRLFSRQFEIVVVSRNTLENCDKAHVPTYFKVIYLKFA